MRSPLLQRPKRTLSGRCRRNFRAAFDQYSAQQLECVGFVIDHQNS